MVGLRFLVINELQLTWHIYAYILAKSRISLAFKSSFLREVRAYGGIGIFCNCTYSYLAVRQATSTRGSFWQGATNDDKWQLSNILFSSADLSQPCDNFCDIWWRPVDGHVNHWWHPIDNCDNTSEDLLTTLMTNGDYLFMTRNDDTDDPCDNTDLRCCLM